MILPRPSAYRATVALGTLRKTLGDDPATGVLARLVASGRIAAPDAKGRVPLAEAVAAYFDTVRADMRAATLTAAVERARAARAESAELKLAESRRELVPAEDAEAAIDALCGAVLSGLTGLPARVTRDIPTRRRIEALAHAAQTALARDLAQGG